MVAVGSLLVGCTARSRSTDRARSSTPAGSGSPSTSVSPTVPAGQVVDVRSYGAVGDGNTDDTAAIQRALSALQPGAGLRFPDGTYCHSEVITVSTSGVQLLGSGVLAATREERSAVKLEASGILVDGLTFATPSTTRRWSTPDQHKLFLGGHDGVVVRNVTIRGSAAAGLFCLGASNFELDGVQVYDTRADGIHMTDGSHGGTVRTPVITRSGDDGVAVVSYLDDGTMCHDITVSGPQVHTTTGGRGLSVVGGKDVTYTDITVESSFAAGVYIACEGSSSVTYPSEGIQVRGGTVSDANTSESIDHGAVLVYSGRSDGGVSDVTVSGLSVTGTRASASRQVGVVVDNGNPASGIRFEDLKLAADPRPYQGNAPQGEFTVTESTAGGHPVEVGQ